MKIESIIESIHANRVRITDHADEEAHNEGLSFEEIFASVSTGEIIEQYLDDRPYPSCLILGKNLKHEPIHSVWAYNPITQASVLITVYRPDPNKWIDWRVRRKS
ncbi:MAG TPA: DUF4258 domain-containing protein [Syntrophaceae bacterium]|nr:DUF4258 domain-containing protein [Syntrophaceae bacterium]